MSDTPQPLIQRIYDRLAIKRFHLEDEKETQRQMALALEEAPAFEFEREVHVAGGIIDFLVFEGRPTGRPALAGSPAAPADTVMSARPGAGALHRTDANSVGIEVKLKGGAGAIARQLHRYAKDPALSGLVFVTAKPVALGNRIGGKPLAVLYLGRAWL